MLSFILIKIDRISKPTIAFQYHFTDQLKADKEISKLLLSPGVLLNKNKTEFEVQILNFISSNFSSTSRIAVEKDFQIIIDLASPSILSFYVINDDLGLDAVKLTKDNNVRNHLNPSRIFSFNRESLKSFAELLQNEIAFLHKRSQELYSAIKNIRPLLSPFVVSPYLYSSGLAKKVRYYNERCHSKSIQHDSANIYIFNSSYKEYESNKTLFSLESGWTDPQIKGSREFINEVLERCSYFEIESKDNLERSNKLTKILGFRVSEFKLFFKPSETKYLTKLILVNLGGKNPVADIVRENTKFGEIISFYINYIKKYERFLVIKIGFIDLIGKCDNFIDELNEQYPVKSLNLSLNNDYQFPIGKETINVKLTQNDILGNCRINFQSL